MINWSSTDSRNTSIGAAKQLRFPENKVIFIIFDKEAAGCQADAQMYLYSISQAAVLLTIAGVTAERQTCGSTV